MRWAVAHSGFAGGWPSRVWLFLTLVSLPVKRRLLPGVALPVRLRLAGRPTTFWFSDASEVLALEEIFAGGEYAAVADASPALIVDLGANVGQAALWFRSRFPAARMLCVEPDPHTLAKLKRNVGGDPLVTVRQAAITRDDGPVRIERTPDSSWGTLVTRSPSANGEQVPGLSLETLLDQHQLPDVDLLKVDIEGMEHEALGASPALARVALVVGELHEDLLDLPPDRAVEGMRRCGGFDRAELRGDIFVLSRDGVRAVPRT